MQDVDIRLLGGPLRVFVAGREITLPRSRKARALLAVLALEPREHTRAALCAQIWPDTADPRADLRWSLSKLRGVLGAGVIVATDAGVRLDPARADTDAGRLAALLEAPEPPLVAEVLAWPQNRFSSLPLPELDARIGVEFELWLASQRQALLRLQQRALALLIDQVEDEPEQALELARRRLALDPLNEAAVVDLLRLTLQVSGRRQAQALLEQARDRLRDAGLPDVGLLAAWRRLSERPPGTGPEPAHDPEPGVVWSLPQKPSVAVLGFENLGSGEDALLGEGISLDLTSSLARLKGLFVIARASTRRFRLSQTPAPEIGRLLGVRYLVHGRTRRLGRRMRVTVDLLECDLGEAIWSEHFERPLDDLFLVQEEIVNAIVSTLEPQIEQAERQRALLVPTENLSAWECFHRAMWHTYRFTSADTEQAQRLLQRALEQDPAFARAYAGLSFTHFSRAFLNGCDDVEAEVRQAVDHARESVALEPRDALGHWSLGRALFLHRSHDDAMAAIDRALVVNPNYAQGHYARGFVGCHAGQSASVYGDLDMAQRLSPFDPLLFAMESTRGIALAVTGRHEEAASWALRATREPNAHFHIFAIAAACLQLVGRTEEAARLARVAQERHPGYTVTVFERSLPHKSDADRRVLSEALIAAGLPR